MGEPRAGAHRAVTPTPPPPAVRRAAVLVVALSLLAGACAGGGGDGEARPGLPAEAAADVSATAGGTVRLGDAAITVPPGALSADARVTIRRAGESRPAPPGPPMARVLGEPYLFAIDGATLRAPASVTVPYDPGRVPAESESLAPFVAAYDDGARGWQPAPSSTAPGRPTVTHQTDRVSWRQAWTWLVPTAREGLTGTVTGLFGLAGGRAPAPVCESEPPSGLALEPPVGDALLACVAERGASPAPGTATAAGLTIANNRPFSVVVRRPSGASLERATRGGLYDRLEAQLSRAFPSAAFVPGGGTAEFRLALPATPVTYELTSAPQPLSAALDVLTAAVSLFAPADVVLVPPVADCLVRALGPGRAGDDRGPSLAAVPERVVACVESVDRANPVALILSRLREALAETMGSTDLVTGDASAARGRVGVKWTPAERLTPESRLRVGGIGPVRIGMTLADASAASGLHFAVDPRSSPHPERCGVAVPEGVPPGLSFMVEGGTTIVRIDVRGAEGSPPTIATEAGIRVGSPEEDVAAAYPGIAVRPHPSVPGGHYLVHVPDDPRVRGFELLFETDGKVVTSFRSGVIAVVDAPEGCR
ncbi:MAG TPA: hypothetical protein VHG90_10460 [Acidimicrobiales bacterium]|nr:hypothetical protein [Acidimicrobiales bacterium]